MAQVLVAFTLILSAPEPADASFAGLTIPTGNGPGVIAVNSITNKIYVANYTDGSVTVIDGATNTILTSVPAGTAPEAVVVDPICGKIFAANRYGTTVTAVTEQLVQDVPLTVSIIPLANNQTLAGITHFTFEAESAYAPYKPPVRSVYYQLDAWQGAWDKAATRNSTTWWGDVPTLQAGIHIIDLSLGNLFKGKSAQLASTGSTDFNGDNKTDVFRTLLRSDGNLQWQYSSGGTAAWQNLAYAGSNLPTSLLQFGEFNGDLKTDVFASQYDNGLLAYQWMYSPGGSGSFKNLATESSYLDRLAPGDFNGDGVTDVFTATAGNNTYQAYRCGMHGPLTFTPLQTLAQSGYSTFYHTLAGDVNGDGLADLILVSTCQNPNSVGFCASNHLQVGAALGTPTQTNTLAAPQQLGANTLDFTYFKVLAGDFDGDGKTDVALISLDATNLTIYIARSNGDGTFTLGSPQTFTGETWSNFNPIVGDFNGDGKADLAFTTVCNLSSGSCSVGNNNSVYVATSSGAGVFTLGARQDLGLIGWSNFQAFAGDFSGDGKTDLLFNSTCQKTNFIDSTCTAGDANFVYTAISDGFGSFTLSATQNYGLTGWSDYSTYSDLIGDVNGDGRADLIWSSSSQTAAKTNNNLVVVGFANPNGTFQLGSVQNFGSAWTGSLSLADLNRDGKADLLWNNAPYGDTDVDTYAAATSNGNGTFNNLGQGSIYTGQGYFQLPGTDDASQLPTSLTLVSTRQDSISNALFVVNDPLLVKATYLPFLRK